jgi:hypothetical protein
MLDSEFAFANRNSESGRESEGGMGIEMQQVQQLQHAWVVF